MITETGNRRRYWTQKTNPFAFQDGGIPAQFKSCTPRSICVTRGDHNRNISAEGRGLCGLPFTGQPRKKRFLVAIHDCANYRVFRIGRLQEGDRLPTSPARPSGHLSYGLERSFPSTKIASRKA